MCLGTTRLGASSPSGLPRPRKTAPSRKMPTLEAFHRAEFLPTSTEVSFRERACLESR